MIALQAYERFLVKLNKNDTNANVNVPKGRFVVIYNEQSKRWLKEKLKQKLSTDELDELSTLLVDPIEPLVKLNKHFDHVDFQVPNDFFQASSSYVIASKGECKGRVLDNWNTKGKNIRILLRDENNKPSFEYEETLFGVSDGKIKVYFDDFEIDEVFLSYYRTPKDIDITGYINSLNQPSTNIDPDLPDMAINEIISRCVTEVTRNVGDPQGFQFSKERQQTEE